MHEGGYRIETQPDGTLIFYRPDRRPLTPLSTTVIPGDHHIRTANHQRGIHPTPDTPIPIPIRDGEHPDYAYIVDILLNTIPS